MKIGDLVTRESYNNDIVFTIIDIEDDIYLFEGAIVNISDPFTVDHTTIKVAMQETYVKDPICVGKYAAGVNAERELKDMVKECHRNGIEVVLHLPFSGETPKQMIEECLRYYVLDFHVDGFVLNPYLAPMESILSDPILKKTKILL